jgi:hypothetical protein
MGVRWRRTWMAVIFASQETVGRVSAQTKTSLMPGRLAHILNLQMLTAQLEGSTWGNRKFLTERLCD